MTWLSDGALRRLRDAADWPDLTATRYDAVERIGRGGMGTVYAARDRELDRLVALKVLSLPDPGPDAIARMLREARIIAHLEHPSIVPIHDVGRLPDGRVYYTMKLVRGRRLDEHARTVTALPELLRQYGRICEAVAFAHDAGVIHRDLKPENVMVGPFGEVLVMDWGVAKLRGERPGAAPIGAVPDDPSSTDHGTVLGTPGYMAPEQAAGHVESVDERTDVFALGAILYFLLTKRVPPTAGPLEPARTVNRGAPKALDAICRKAMAPTPADRYPGVEALGADVERFLAREHVEAYPEGLLERGLRLVSKYRTPILLVLAYLLMRVILLLVGGS